MKLLKENQLAKDLLKRLDLPISDLDSVIPPKKAST